MPDTDAPAVMNVLRSLPTYFEIIQSLQSFRDELTKKHMGDLSQQEGFCEILEDDENLMWVCVQALATKGWF